MQMTPMYPAMPNSPQTLLAADIDASASIITVSDATKLPDAPNYATLGLDENAEVVYYASKQENTLLGVVRGQSGTLAQIWPAGTEIYRDLTVSDHQAFINNITALDARLTLDSLKALLLDAMHPVGSVYMSVDNANPAALFGGTWVAWGAGRVPVSVDADGERFNAVEETGGAASAAHTHTLAVNSGGAGTSGGTAITTAQMPSHTHVQDSHQHSGLYWESAGSKPIDLNGGTAFPQGYKLVSELGALGSHANMKTYTATATNQNTGGGGAHTHSTPAHAHTGTAVEASVEILPPYITCYMWKRTA